MEIVRINISGQIRPLYTLAIGLCFGACETWFGARPAFNYGDFATINYLCQCPLTKLSKGVTEPLCGSCKYIALRAISRLDALP